MTDARFWRQENPSGTEHAPMNNLNGNAAGDVYRPSTKRFTPITQHAYVWRNE